jgi:PKD repeat protein
MRQRYRVVWVALWCVACSGTYTSDFKTVVVNKTANPLQVMANGSGVGTVAAGQSSTISLRLTESGQNVLSNGVTPTPVAQVTVTARDQKSGAVSDEKALTLAKDQPGYVTFTTADFPASSATVARFTFSPTSAGLNQDVSFNASSSTAPPNATYTWDFGDGQTGTGSNVTHRFTRAASFNVTLTVASDTGVSSTASRTVAVSGVLTPQAATFTFSPTNPAINQAVVFTASGAGGGGTITFPGGGAPGGGAPAPGGGVPGRGGTPTPTPFPGAPGGQFPGGPFPGFPGNQQAPDVVFYNWDFGDGSTASGATVTHTFTRGGTITVTLRAQSATGQSASSSRTVTVSTTLPAASVNFTYSPTDPGLADTVFFNAASTTVVNPTFNWDFGDGTTGSGVAPSHVFSRPGTYSVTLTVRNDLSQTVAVSKSVTVGATSNQFVASFTFSPTDPTLATGTNAVIFDATDSSPAASSWTWDFGDGSSSSGSSGVTHTFAKAGSWVVRLTITDGGSRTATTTRTVTVVP